MKLGGIYDLWSTQVKKGLPNFILPLGRKHPVTITIYLAYIKTSSIKP